MSRFEKYVKDNKEEFESSPLPLGHDDRFMQRLMDFRQYAVKSNGNRKWLLYAAAIVIVLLSIPATLYFFDENSQMEYSVENYLNNEQQEAHIYYVASIESGFSTLEKMLSNSELPKEQYKVLEEVMANFETKQNEIIKDLNVSAGDERVVDALLDYYRIKLEVINGMVQKLESLNENENETEQNVEL